MKSEAVGANRLLQGPLAADLRRHAGPLHLAPREAEAVCFGDSVFVTCVATIEKAFVSGVNWNAENQKA